MKGMKTLFLVMFLTTLVAVLWESLPFIKTSVHTILDPTLGAFLTWNVVWGMVTICAIITLLTTLVQKYATDQKTLKELREESKILNEQMKRYKDHPEKMMEIQKKQFEIIGKTMPLTMRPVLYTGIPFVLLFRWFNDYFLLNPNKIFGMSWFWAYLLLSIAMSIVLRKFLKVQ